MEPQLTILFLCTGNSCRSQMAEGWARELMGEKFQFLSAGIEAHGLNPFAVEVMNEVGINISNQKSKTLEDIEGEIVDLVITVCDNASETCPHFPGEVEVIHQSFDDPPKLAEDYDSDEDKLECYREVRDEIKDFILAIREEL